MSIRKHHNTFAIKDNCIGFICYWKFKDVLWFLNHEKGVVETLKGIEDVKGISKKEYQKLYEERNTPGTEGREKSYGKLHDIRLDMDAVRTSYKTGQWSYEFARDFGSLCAITAVYFDVKKEFNITDKKELVEKHKDRFKEIYISREMGFESDYFVITGKVMDEEITEKEITDAVEKYKTMPEEWQVTMMESEEMKFYLSK